MKHIRTKVQASIPNNTKKQSSIAWIRTYYPIISHVSHNNTSSLPRFVNYSFGRCKFCTMIPRSMSFSSAHAVLQSRKPVMDKHEGWRLSQYPAYYSVNYSVFFPVRYMSSKNPDEVEPRPESPQMEEQMRKIEKLLEEYSKESDQQDKDFGVNSAKNSDEEAHKFVGNVVMKGKFMRALSILFGLAKLVAIGDVILCEALGSWSLKALWILWLFILPAVFGIPTYWLFGRNNKAVDFLSTLVTGTEVVQTETSNTPGDTAAVNVEEPLSKE